MITKSKFAALALGVSLLALGMPIAAPVAHAAISSVNISPSDNVVNATSDYDFEFDSSVSSQTKTITVTFPSGYDINDGVTGALGDGSVNDVICSGSCTYDGYVSIGTGDDEGLLPVASVVLVAANTVRITLTSNVDLSGDTVYFRLKQGIENPSASGNYNVSIKTGADTTAVADAVTIVGNPDDFGYIIVTPDDNSITADDTTDFTAEAYDSNGNDIGDVTGDTDFSVEYDWDGGSMSGATYTPDHTGTWTIEGCYNESCDTADVTVSHGVGSALAITDYDSADAYDYTDTDLYPGDSNTYYANLVDHNGNFVQNENIDWTFDVSDGVSQEDFSTTTNSATLNAHLVGSATLHASDGSHTDSLGVDVDSFDCEFGCEDHIGHIELSPASDTVADNHTEAFSVEAYDSEGNDLGDVTDSADFSISEGAGGSFSDGLYTPENTGEFTVTASYGGSDDTATLTVTPSALDHFEVTPSTYSPTADDAFTVTLTAYDTMDNVKTDYTSGSVAWSWNAGGNDSPNTSATLPADGTQSFTDGVASDISGFYLPKTETARITATADTKSGTSDEITVSPGALNDFTVVPGDLTPTTDDSFNVVVTARDAEQNVKTDYTSGHSITWTYSGSAAATSPADNDASKPSDGSRTFTAGVADVSGFRLRVPGTATVTAAADSKSGTSGTVTVSLGAINSFAVSGITDPINVGTASNVSVTALDSEENVKTDYDGTVHFSSSDDSATLPDDYTFTEGDAGAKTFTGGVTFGSSGEQEVTVSDSDVGEVSGSQSDITVNHGNAVGFTVTPSTYSPTAGIPFNLLVQAVDSLGNIVGSEDGTPYTGRIALSTNASGSYSFIPNPYTFQSEDNGAKTISVTLVNAESGKSITATDLDAGEVSGTATGINVSAPGNLSVTGIDADQTVATPGAGFTSGFQWTFHITVPDNETHVQLKFGDFTSGEDTIPAASNIRYYSAQSSDHASGSAVVVSGNDYGTAMTINGDTDEEIPGRQIDVIVQMKVPSDTAGGSYSGTYGIKSAGTPPA